MQKSLTTVALLSLALLAPQSGAAPREFDSIAAVVNGQVITRSEINDAIKHTREMIMISIPPGAERDKQLRTLREDALNSLIERELILAEFKKLGGAVKDEFIELDAEGNPIKRKAEAPNKEARKTTRKAVTKKVVTRRAPPAALAEADDEAAEEVAAEAEETL